MKNRRLILNLFILFSVLMAVSLPLHAAEEGLSIMKGEGPVDIEADQLIYERETQTFEGNGQVEVSRGEFFLKADHARLNNATKDLTAWGNVLLREGEDVVECQRLEVNLKTQAGKIYEARLFLKDQNFHLTGQVAEKLGENHYRIKDGSLTTCDAKRPPWKFTVKELEVKEMATGGWGVAKGPVFYLKNIPVFYFPWGIFPVRQDRQSGFLFPQPGYSSRDGAQVKTGFYWAFRKDMDATLYLDWLGKRGFKEGVEYRYALTQDTSGKANFNFISDKSVVRTQRERLDTQIDDRVLFNDPVFNSQTIHPNRYAFFIEHQQKLPEDFYLKADINRVSDHQYLQDFDQDIPDTASVDAWSLRQLRSTLFGGKNWDHFSFLTETTAYDDLTRKNNEDTSQKLPQISFNAHPQSLFGSPLFFDLTSSYSNFWRAKGVETQRGDFFPRFTYAVRLFDVLKFESDIGGRETYYKSKYREYHKFNILVINQNTGAIITNDSTDLHPEVQFNQSESRETFEGGMQLSSEFYRVYDGDLLPGISSLFKVSKWMHTIEPLIRYDYSPRVSQREIPVFDNIDRIPYTNQVTYGITQRLIGRPEKEGIDTGPFEYAKLVLSQSYSLGDPFIYDTRIISKINIDSQARLDISSVASEKTIHFSNIKGELWWNFNPNLSAYANAELNPHRWSFDVFNFFVKAKDRRDDAIQVQYRQTRATVQNLNLPISSILLPPLPPILLIVPPYLAIKNQNSLRQVNLDARIKTINPLYLYGSFRYNLLEGMRVEHILGAEYQSQCWSLGFYVQDRNHSPDGTQKREVKYQIYLTLLNLGSTGQRPYFMGL